MTLLGPLFHRGEMGAATTLTPRNDVITSDVLPVSMLGSIVMGPDYTATYEEIVKTQLWARTAVNKLAYSIGRLPLKVYQRAPDGSRERATDSALAELLRRPNQTKETGHPAGFQARVAYDLFTYANALILKVQSRPDAVPSELRPVSPQGWRIEKDGTYRQRRVDGTERVYEPWQLIHLIEPGPVAGGWGVSRWEAARLTLAIEYAAQKLGVATFRNGARPGGLINVKGMPTESTARAAAMERFKAEVKARYGGVDKSGLPAVVEGEVSWTPMAHNLDDTAVVAHRQLTKMEVAALLDIPQPAMGILDEANFASVDALHLMFYQDSLGWPVNLIEDVFGAQLIDGVPEFEGEFVEFDMNAVMRGAFSQRMTGYMQGINGRIFTPDEVRGWENLPPMAGTQPDAGKLQFPLNYSASPEPPGRQERP